MLSVHDIAKFVLTECGPMTAMKLQKLVFYSQAWALALLKRPLFDQKTQAWAYGPVVYELFSEHRGQYSVSDTALGDAANLAAEEREFVKAVLSHYGTMTGVALSDLTHSEVPWKKAREGIPEGSLSSHPITSDDMRRYYGAQVVPFAWGTASQ